MSWPAPLPAPTTLHMLVGPDTGSPGNPGPVAESLIGWAQMLESGWLGYPTEVSEGVASVDYGGALGGRAMSDNEPFMAAGIPVFVPMSCSEVCGLFLHKESDTLENLTKYALFGEEADYESPGWSDDALRRAGEELVARSFEPYLWFAFYHILVADDGRFDPLGLPVA